MRYVNVKCTECGNALEVAWWRLNHNKSKRFYCNRKCKGLTHSKLQRNENHPAWKGNNVGIKALHRWIESRLGKPLKCDSCGIIKDKTTQIHWANKSHKYKRDLNDWLRLCVKCHSKYDRGLLKAPRITRQFINR